MLLYPNQAEVNPEPKLLHQDAVIELYYLELARFKILSLPWFDAFINAIVPLNIKYFIESL